MNSWLPIPELSEINFRELRLKSKYTLRTVEELTGISNPYLSQLERGKIKSPSYTTVKALYDLYMKPKPKVKLDTLWVSDSSRHGSYLPQDEPDPLFISHGIWLTNGMETNNGSITFTMKCVASYHRNLSIGDIRKVNHDVLLVIAHQVKLVHLPKTLPNSHKQDS